MLATVIKRVNTRMEANTASTKLLPREVGDNVNIVKLINGEMLSGNRIWAVDDKGVKQWSGALQIDFEKVITNGSDIFNKFHIKELWNFSTGENVNVCIVDSGIKQTESLKGAVKKFDSDLSSIGNKPLHGTYMAEIIAAWDFDNSIFGIAPNSQIKSSKINFSSFTPDGINTVLVENSDADIFNFSLSRLDGSTFSDASSEAVQSLIKELSEFENTNKVLIAATGNHGITDDTRTYPANLVNFISVGGLTFPLGIEQKLWSGSNCWKTVSLLASSDRYFESNRDEYNGFEIGTSVSCAFVTGMIALLMSYCKKKGILDFHKICQGFISGLPTLKADLTHESITIRQLSTESLLNLIKTL